MANQDRYEILENAIMGGLFGATLGLLFTEKKESRVIASLVGAALGATYQAYKEAEKINSGVLFEEDNIIYRELPNGEKILVKKLERQQTKVPKTFTLG